MAELRKTLSLERSTQEYRPIDILASDGDCTALLLEYATPVFPAELVSGPGWKVRLQPPATGTGWVHELLSLVERWLDSAHLPCATVLYGGRRYLIRSGAKGASV